MIYSDEEKTLFHHLRNLSAFDFPCKTDTETGLAAAIRTMQARLLNTRVRLEKNSSFSRLSSIPVSAFGIEEEDITWIFRDVGDEVDTLSGQCIFSFVSIEIINGMPWYDCDESDIAYAFYTDWEESVRDYLDYGMIEAYTGQDFSAIAGGTEEMPIEMQAWDIPKLIAREYEKAREKIDEYIEKNIEGKYFPDKFGDFFLENSITDWEEYTEEAFLYTFPVRADLSEKTVAGELKQLFYEENIQIRYNYTLDHDSGKLVIVICFTEDSGPFDYITARYGICRLAQEYGKK